MSKSKRDNRVYLELTERTAISRLELQSTQAAADGKPGMVVAQIIGGEMRVQFIGSCERRPLTSGRG